MARQRIGSGSVSSLLKSAASAANTVQNNNDQLQAYQFEIDGKTQEAYDTYSAYLKKRKESVTDPMKVLALTKAEGTAFNGYRSSAIRQESLGINYGTESLYGKRDKLDDLYKQAAAIGDESTMSSIELQRSNLDIQIQNQEAAAARASGGGGGGGGSSYETTAGSNAEKTFGDMNTISNHLKSQLAQGKMSYSDFLQNMQQVAQTTTALSRKIQAEQEARANGTSTNDPDVAGMSESDLAAIQKKSDSYFGSSEYKQFSPDSLHRAQTYGQQDFGVHYNNGVAETVQRPVESEFNNPDGSTGNVYKSGDIGSKGWFNFRDANKALVPTQVDLYDHDPNGQHTPYKSFMAPDGKGGFKQKIEMNVVTGKDKNGNDITKSIYVDPTKPGATKFLQDWASNNNDFTKAANNFGQIAGNVGNYVDPTPGFNLLKKAVSSGIATMPGVKNVDDAMKALQPEAGKIITAAKNGGIGGAFNTIKDDITNGLRPKKGQDTMGTLMNNLPGASLVKSAAGAINGFLAGNSRKVQADNLAKAQAAAAAATAQRQAQQVAAQAASIRAAQSSNAQVRSATPAVAANFTAPGNAVIAAARKANPNAPVSTQPISQAQANAANTVGNMGGYQTNMKPAPVKQSLAAKVGSWLGW